MAKGAVHLVPDEPFTVMVSNFGHRAVHIPKHTVVGLSLPSPTHILTLGVSTLRGAEANERGGEIITRDGIINSSTAMEEHVRREGPAMDNARNRDSCNADEQTDTERTQGTDIDKARSWEEDVHIGAEDSTVCAEVMDMRSEFKGTWSGYLGKIDATKHRIELKRGAWPIY